MAFTRVLVANRGEIAVRIIKSVHDLGYESVAVFSDADADAPFVAMANRAVPLGPPQVSQSYLDGEKIIRAAKAAGADAIHPGYGFLSENAGFADRCREAGLIFIGPLPHSIRAMGDKRQAKERMLEAGVPCIPGHLGGEQDEAAFTTAARTIGLPVIIKAAAGGGGRGMRLVRAFDDLGANLRAARSEAQNAFGDGTLYLEKLVEHGRHIEIQIVADQHGNVVHLGERDCSVQRRFQKVMEEAPSPFVDASLREAMGAAAIAAAKAVDYVGVGTVEFLVDAERGFYFIEMNTRLQVEHPVTEMVCGLDLVELQLRVAAGEPLPFSQSDIRIDGHAIEARLYAEDAENGYLPQTGRILHWRPRPAAGVRIDSGVVEGMELTSHYDAMVAKVIAHAPTRDAARRRLTAALRATPLLGLATNRSLLLAIAGHPDFASGAAATDFLQVTEFVRPERPATVLQIAAALLHGWPETYDLARWLRAGPSEWSLEVGDVKIGIRRRRSGEVSATTPDGVIDIRPLAIGDANLRCQIGQVVFSFTYVRTPDVIEIDLEGERLAVDRFVRHDGSASQEEDTGAVLSPLNGRVIKIDVEAGQRVARGDGLVVIEAMKMEMALNAPTDGIIGPVSVRVGDQVSARQEILFVGPEEREET